MDVVKGVRYYVEKMVADTPGMKVLLLDKETVRHRKLQQEKEKRSI